MRWSEEIQIESEKRGVRGLIERYYDLLDDMKGADIPSFNISSNDMQDAIEGIKRGRYFFKTIKLPFDPHGKEDISKKAFLLGFTKCLDNGFAETVGRYWENGFCPVCGSLPGIGVLGEKNEVRMSLVCSFCEMQWDFRRMLCPFCINEDQNMLGYFYPDGDEGYRVNYCDKCKTYLKIIDVRKNGKIYPFPIEDILTLSLDIITQEKGYKRLAPNPFGMVTVK
ncbi:MAG: formate dehydrogenase accessory protein FdhE [Nitrospirae bacterium]|nr:formate dehydrogenase accessory protein FdhE [Nitrospirota bacterium]